MLYQATTKYFCAGLETDEAGNVVLAAPIIRWMLGKNIQFVEKWLAGKDGTLTKV